jgi:hypothetical protein
MNEKHGEARAESQSTKKSKLFRVLVLGGAVLAGAAALSHIPAAAASQQAAGGDDGGGVPGW